VGLNPSRITPTLYFGKNIPKADGQVHGGAVKLQRLQEYFPVSKKHCNLLYLVSSSQPPYADLLVKRAKKRGVKIVWNQNGVSYPASEPKYWKETNNEMKRIIHQADYVIYQSKFCKESADEFLGVFEGPQSIVYNSVDTNYFIPRREGGPSSGPLTLLLGGNQYRRYRLESALQTVAELKKTISDVQLIVTGRVAWDGKKEDECLHDVQKIIKNLAIVDIVQFTGKYSQKEAPNLYNRADILLHTKWRDPCPGLVIEAMSCGLPVVYSDSGGVPELVGNDAGVGIPAKGSWEMIDPPDPELLSAAVLEVADRLESYSENARKRAVNLFDISHFMHQHVNIFNQVLYEP